MRNLSRIKKITVLLCAVVFIVAIPLTMLACCKKDKNDKPNDENVETTLRDYTEGVYKTYTPTLNVTDSKVEIGVSGVQKWVFNKVGSNWCFDGVYAMRGKNEEKVFVGSSGKLDENDAIREDGYYFTVLSTSDAEGIDKSINGMVTQISVVENTADVKTVSLKGKGFESTLSVNKNSQFVDRRISIKPQYTTDISTGDISFVLRGKVDEYSEYGYILSRKNEDEQYSLPYSFPAIAGKLTKLSDASKEYTYINVVDYYDTADCFKTARRRIGLNYFFEEGILSSNGTLYNDMENNFAERVCVRAGNSDTFYDLIYDARYEYGQLYNLDVETLVTANSNMNVYDWDEAVYGATYDIIDSRGRPLGDELGTWGPYGYQNGGAESFGAMNMLKGLIRYAKATADQELYDFAMKYLLQIVTPDPIYGKCYIMPLNSEPEYAQFHGDYFFFLGCFGGNYGAVDTYMGAGSMHFGSFKYFSRVSQLGELALLTGNEQVKNAYLKLMVMVKRLRGANFEQPVEWGHDGLPKLGFENGGSSGAEAMWANCMYIASQLTSSQTEKAEYLDFMKKATDLANKQGFKYSSSLRDAPKPETSGYLARMNIVLYESTGDKSYLNYALMATQGIYFFYFHNSHPYTYFQTLGYGYACAHERWEAFMEMVESLELLVPIFKYTDDPLLYQLYFSLRESALSTLPVNGYPEGVLGGHADWLDALYVPFEQPTGVVGDNGLQDGGASSYRRWSKEQYGMGEMYLGALMYSTQGKAVDSKVLVLNYTSTWLHCSRTTNSYKLYNFGATANKIVAFPNYDVGNYTVTKDGTVVGTYTSTQLANGIAIKLENNKPAHVVVAPSNQQATDKAVQKQTAMEIKDVESDSATVIVTAENASYYKLFVSRSSAFDKYNTTVKTSESPVFHLGFEDLQELFVKAVAYDENGNPFIDNVGTIVTNDVLIGGGEDFGVERVTGNLSMEGWTAQSKFYKGAISFGVDLNDFDHYPTDTEKYRAPTGYMAVYKPAFSGYDVDTFTKTYAVDMSSYPLFDFYPVCKNFMSKFSLDVIVNGTKYNLINKVDSFDLPNYRFNLAELTGLTGNQEVTVVITSEGYNRGFAINKMRFVNEIDRSSTYDLTGVSYAGNSTVKQQNGMLVIENGESVTSSNKFAIPSFDFKKYTEMEILFTGMSDNQNGFIKAEVNVYEGTNKVYTKAVGSVSSGKSILLPLSEMNLSADKNYQVEVLFKRGTSVVKNIVVKTIRLKSNELADDTQGFDAQLGYVPTVAKIDGKYQMVNGWTSNWAFPSVEDGTIANLNPNVGYGSIYKSGIQVDLDETPVIRFGVSKNKGNVTWSLKVNDGTMAVDLLLMQSSDVGTFEVNVKDAFNRSGIIYLRLDFYVINDMFTDGSLGVYFDGYAFIKGKTLYDNITGGTSSITNSEEFTLNTSVTDYLVLDIPELTYGAKWLVYLVDENGVEYELKTINESIYAKMYFRGKEGVFKYQLSDILPKSLQGKNAKFTLKIVLSGKNTKIVFGSIRLATDNDTLVLQEVCKIR